MVLIGISYLSMLFKAWLVRLFEGLLLLFEWLLSHMVGRCDHVLRVGSSLGPYHVVTWIVEPVDWSPIVGHRRSTQVCSREHCLIDVVFVQVPGGPPGGWRRVAVHRRARLEGGSAGGHIITQPTALPFLQDMKTSQLKI